MHSQQNVELRAERAWNQTVYRPKAKVAGVSQLEKKTDIFVTIL